MKKLLLLFLFANLSYGQTLSESNKLQQLGLVWGLVKYHHPEVSRGKFNWDKEFLSILEHSKQVTDQKELNVLLLQLCTLGNGKKTRFKAKKKGVDEDVFKKNEDFGWIHEYDFGPELTRQLLELKENSRIGDHYASEELLNRFLNFENEKGLPHFDYRSENHRLLLLYNFWNAIQYWYVNKYLMEENWRDSLASLTRDFTDADTREKFELAKLKMIAKLRDSHSYTISSYFRDSLHNRFPAFNGKLVNDSLLVTTVIKKELAAGDSIHPGDIITAVNNVPVKQYMLGKFAPLISTSNDNYLRARIEKWLLLSSNTDSLNITVFSPRSQTSTERRIRLFEKFEAKDITQHLYTPRKEKWYDITPEITYINLGAITSPDLKKVFNSSRDKKGIILDLRSYPREIADTDLSKFLYPKKKKFLKVLFPIGSRPSYGDPDGKAPLRFIIDPFKTGRRNRNYYKGKVVLLVNRNTMSKGEYLAMTIQGAPNCTTIGEQTAGAPLNIWFYTLADQQKVSFTGLGGFYPDGRGVQKTGVALDHVIKESALHYDPDLYLKEAVKIINGNKS